MTSHFAPTTASSLQSRNIHQKTMLAKSTNPLMDAKTKQPLHQGRAVLGGITNQQQRVQPFRAAKQVCVLFERVLFLIYSYEICNFTLVLYLLYCLFAFALISFYRN